MNTEKSINSCNFCINSLSCLILKSCTLNFINNEIPNNNKNKRRFITRLRNAGNDTENVINLISKYIEKEPKIIIKLTKFEELCIKNLKERTKLIN